jgi:hypothetical protein
VSSWLLAVGCVPLRGKQPATLAAARGLAVRAIAEAAVAIMVVVELRRANAIVPSLSSKAQLRVSTTEMPEA